MRILHERYGGLHSATLQLRERDELNHKAFAVYEVRADGSTLERRYSQFLELRNTLAAIDGRLLQQRRGRESTGEQDGGTSRRWPPLSRGWRVVRQAHCSL